MAPDRIHVFGASGSGTSTLGRAIAVRAGHGLLDADDFYWMPSDPPYRIKREIPARVSLLGAALEAQPRWVLSGSVTSWGDAFVPRFQRVVFLDTETSVRLARLRQREEARYGAARIGPGGDLHAQHEEFIAWACAYETGVREGRCRWKHEAWLERLPSSCHLLRLDGSRPVDDLVGATLVDLPGAARPCPPPPSPAGR